MSWAKDGIALVSRKMATWFRVFFEMPSDMIISWKGGRRDADREIDKRECISRRNAAILQ